MTQASCGSCSHSELGCGLPDGTRTGSGLLTLYGDKPLKVRAVAGIPGLRKITALCGGGDIKKASALYHINSPLGKLVQQIVLFLYFHLEENVYSEATAVT